MKYLMATDLDNTLVGDDQATVRLNQHLRSRRSQITLVYATGRSYPSARQLMIEKALLAPDYWITGVGTEIYRRGALDRTWANTQTEYWNRATIAKIVQEFPDLQPQPAVEQNPWKVSLWLKNANSDILDILWGRLLQAGIAAQIVFSNNRDVDILPKSADKGKALAYLRAILDISPSDTLVCGDSGNDISLFEQSACGVIVRNAQPELLNWYHHYGQPHHYLAKKSYAGGILEGLKKFQFSPG